MSVIGKIGKSIMSVNFVCIYRQTLLVYLECSIEYNELQ